MSESLTEQLAAALRLKGCRPDPLPGDEKCKGCIALARCKAAGVLPEEHSCDACDALRELASYFAAGGYNAPDPINVAEFVKKIKGGAALDAERAAREALAKRVERLEKQAQAELCECNISDRRCPVHDKPATPPAAEQPGKAAGWTDAVPTKPGWYWWRYESELTMKPMWVSECNRPPGGEWWLEPIPAPGDAKAVYDPATCRALIRLLETWADTRKHAPAAPPEYVIDGCIDMIEACIGQSLHAGHDGATATPPSL